MLLILFGLLGCEAIATGDELRYVDLQTDAASTALIQTSALPMSQYPTTLCMALSAKHSVLRTVDVDGKIWQWELHPPPKPVMIGETQSEPACAAMSSDGRFLAVADFEGAACVTDLETMRVEFSIPAQDGNIATLQFSSDGVLLAAVSNEGGVGVWNVSSGDSVADFDVGASDIQSIAFSPDGETIAVSSFSDDVSLFQLGSDGKVTKDRVLSVDASNVSAIAFTPTGSHIVIAAANGTASVRDLADGQPPVELESHPFGIWSLSFDSDGTRMVAGSWDGTTRIWDTSSWRLLQKTKSHEESVVITLLDDRGMVSAGLDGRLMFWPPQPNGLDARGVIEGSMEPIWIATYSDDGSKLFVGGRGQRFQIWNTETNTVSVSIKGHPTTRCATFSPDGKTLVTGGDDHQIWVLSTGDGKITHKLDSKHGSISALTFTDDGRTLVSGCDRGILKFWDVATWKETTSRRKHKQQLYCATASPDHQWLITGGGHWAKGDPGELIVWDLKNRSFKKSLSGHKLTVWSIVFAPDGSYFATSDSAGEVKIWDTKTLEEKQSLQHTTWVRPLAISPDGRTLAVGRGDGSVRLWDTQTWQQKTACTGHESFTFWLEYSPDGSSLASSSNDGTIRFWKAVLLPR